MRKQRTKRLLRRAARPNTAPSAKLSMTQALAASALSFSNMSSTQSRFSDNPLGKDPQLANLKRMTTFAVRRAD